MNEVIEAVQANIADVKRRYRLGVICRGCLAPFEEWDTLHPLFRSWSGKCPDCHTRDIRLDFAHKNQED